KAVVVYYWASWNLGTRTDFATLQALRNKYKGQFEVGGVNLDDQADRAQQYLHHTPLNDAIHDYERGALDCRLAMDYGMAVVRMAFLLDRDGKVVNRNAQMNLIEDEIKKLLK